MTDPTTLLALAERCEQADGPDRELDAEIEACLTSRVTHPLAPGWTFEAQNCEWKLARLAEIKFISRASRPAPHYTASLDAAVMLVPEGCGYDFGKNLLGYAWGGVTMPDHNEIEISADTPALALCAAALRARAAMLHPAG
jgi:hypothetical protein